MYAPSMLAWNRHTRVKKTSTATAAAAPHRILPKSLLTRRDRKTANRLASPTFSMFHARVGVALHWLTSGFDVASRTFAPSFKNKNWPTNAFILGTLNGALFQRRWQTTKERKKTKENREYDLPVTKTREFKFVVHKLYRGFWCGKCGKCASQTILPPGWRFLRASLKNASIRLAVTAVKARPVVQARGKQALRAHTKQAIALQPDLTAFGEEAKLRKPVGSRPCKRRKRKQTSKALFE